MRNGRSREGGSLELLQTIRPGKSGTDEWTSGPSGKRSVNNQQQQYFSLPPLPLLVNISVHRAKAFRHQLSSCIHQNKCCLTRRYRLAVVASCCLQAIVAPAFHCPARPLRFDTNIRATRQPISSSAILTLTRRFDSRPVSEKHCESGAAPQTPLVSHTTSVTASARSS
jgi:hypothetical protein